MGWVFHLLSEHNVTRAARRLNFSQPSVSVHLAKLRKIFADPLLLPGPRGMRPTARTNELREPLRQALDALEQAVSPNSPFDPAKASHTWREILGDRRFWLLSLAIEIFTAGGVFTSAMWLIFSQVSAPSLMVALGFLMGAGMGPTVTLHSACINEIFGPQNFSRVIGYTYFVKIPFLFAPAPLVGRLYDVTGGYGSAYLAVVAGLIVAALLATVLAFDRHRRTSAGPPFALSSIVTPGTQET